MRVPTTLGDLYVEDVGQGPPVLLWHSFLHHGGMWKAQVEALRTSHRVVNIDAPGHGRSSIIHRPFSLAECARAAVAVMDACKLPRAAMAGLSWGGMVAMQLAVQEPERLTGIAVFDASCRREPSRNRLKYKVMGTILRTMGAMPALMDRVEPLFFRDVTRKERRDLIDPWRGYVARLDPISVLHGLECIMGRADLTDSLRRAAVPTLVGCGAEDRAQPIAQSQHIAQTIARAELAIIPAAAHLAAVENPSATTAVLRSFLEKLPN